MVKKHLSRVLSAAVKAGINAERFQIPERWSDLRNMVTHATDDDDDPIPDPRAVERPMMTPSRTRIKISLQTVGAAKFEIPLAGQAPESQM